MGTFQVCQIPSGRRWLSFLLIVIFGLLEIPSYGSAYMVGNNPFHRVEMLDGYEGRFQLEWIVDWEQERIRFNVTAATRGYVGFGLSRNGKMTGADIVIGGVTPGGKTYFTDRHGVGDWAPEIDPNQDWELHSAWESESGTYLSFSRAFDTCDPQDYPITEDKISLIWALGEDDETEYHYENRGVFQVYLLQPDYSPQVYRDEEGNLVGIEGGGVEQNLTDLSVWTAMTRFEMPSDDTTYWCTIHAPPQLRRKHHVVGLEVRFPTEESRRHSHHISIYKCHAPDGVDPASLFGPFVNLRGQSCLNLAQPVGPMPTEYCTEFFQSWAIGGRRFFFPPHVGVPIGTEEDEFILFQTHYDNPDQQLGIVVEASIDMFYTGNLRPNDAALMVVRTPSPGQTPTILIPPFTADHTTYAHCSSECTRRMLPKDGISVAAGFLHAHNSGQGLKLQHFRANRELPWIMSDDNYGITYQQFRALRKEVKILPGDQLTVRCTYDNTWANGTVVGGFSTRQEMCVAIVLYYSKLEEYGQCNSEIVSEEYRRHFLGVSNITWDNSRREYVVDPFQPFSGLPITEVSDKHVDWTLESRAELQRFHLYHPHVNTCPKLRLNPSSLSERMDGTLENAEDNRVSVVYPVGARPHKPKRSCSFRGDEDER